MYVNKTQIRVVKVLSLLTLHAYTWRLLLVWKVQACLSIPINDFLL